MTKTQIVLYACFWIFVIAATIFFVCSCTLYNDSTFVGEWVGEDSLPVLTITTDKGSLWVFNHNSGLSTRAYVAGALRLTWTEFSTTLYYPNRTKAFVARLSGFGEMRFGDVTLRRVR